MIQISRPSILPEDKERVMAVLESGRLAAGPVVEEFEDALARYAGVRYAVATSSGTSALCAAAAGVGWGPGDLVITTSFSFIATANALVSVGAVPVFVDIDPETYNLHPAAVEDALVKYPRCKGILVVHLYGLPADMDAIMGLAESRGIPVVEDCAQSIGASVGGKRTGAIGSAGAFSFYATKNLATGEGGAVTSNDLRVIERVRRFINHGQSARYFHDSLGYNFRMTEMQAALGTGQFRRLDHLNDARRAHAAVYDSSLSNVTTPSVPAGMSHVFHQYTLRTSRRAALMDRLAQADVEARVYYPRIMPDQEVYRSLPCIVADCSRARAAAGEVLSIPVHPLMTPEEVHYVAGIVNSAADEEASSDGLLHSSVG